MTKENIRVEEKEDPVAVVVVVVVVGAALQVAEVASVQPFVQVEWHLVQIFPVASKVAVGQAVTHPVPVPNGPSHCVAQVSQAVLSAGAVHPVVQSAWHAAHLLELVAAANPPLQAAWHTWSWMK